MRAGSSAPVVLLVEIESLLVDGGELGAVDDSSTLVDAVPIDIS